MTFKNKLDLKNDIVYYIHKNLLKVKLLKAFLLRILQIYKVNEIKNIMQCKKLKSYQTHN